jgi:hypothetical protein
LQITPFSHKELGENLCNDFFWLKEKLVSMLCASLKNNDGVAKYIE